MRRLALFIMLPMVLTSRTQAQEVAPIETYSEDQREHWSYQPIRRPDPPTVQEKGWVRNPIDQFVLFGIEDIGFQHASEASRIELVRRVCYDLTGLPPTREQVREYLDDQEPGAYERLVDRLLASPAYGERWAQHWLDLAHYADTNGFETDADRPDAWRYRDWVVKALNSDMPYDRFVQLQLAGDEVNPGDADALIATGFGRCGPREIVGGNVEAEVKRQSELTEVASTVGSVFLGLTMGCARCHDHKFDPLPTTDYYRLQSFFAASQFSDRPIASKADETAYAQARKAIDARLAPLRKELAALEAPYRKRLKAEKEAALTDAERAVTSIPEKDRTDVQKKLAQGVNKALAIHWEEVAEAVDKNPDDHAERDRLKRAIFDVQQEAPRPPAKAMALVDEGTDAPESFVLFRGDVKNHGPRVGPRPPGILLASMADDAFPKSVAPTGSTTGRRLALARWLTRSDNPLTARVLVNRLWQHHFGSGIVATPSDFGVRGESPSHPELLDWLASELIDGGWRLKPIHRLIVTSSAYRQSSRPAKLSQLTDDPENLFLAHQNRKRRDAESIRDAMLMVSDDLNPKLGGPGVRPSIEPEVEALIFTEAEVVDLWPETPSPSEHLRRSLYLYRKRNVHYALYDAFDAPDTQTACPRRDVSTHALQPLVLLHSAFAMERAEALAGRILDDSCDRPGRIDSMYQRVLSRSPSQKEIDLTTRFLDEQTDLLGRLHSQGQPLARPSTVPDGLSGPEAAAWVDLARAMLNRSEFLYVP